MAYLGATVAAILAGLASRRYPGVLADLFGKFPGDALWAVMAFCGWGVLLPKASTARLAGVTLLTCVAIETLKLHQAPWIVAIRQTMLGHLVFGTTFSFANLAAYAIGIALAGLMEGLCLPRRPPSDERPVIAARDATIAK